jgi:hypothetical protein
MQNHYSLIYREEEREMIPTLKVIIIIIFEDLPINPLLTDGCSSTLALLLFLGLPSAEDCSPALGTRLLREGIQTGKIEMRINSDLAGLM